MSLFIFSGALIRQYFVLLHSGQNKLGYPVAGVLLLVIIGWLAAPAPRPAPTAADDANKVTLAQVQEIMDARCIQCHAVTPEGFGFTAPPLGMLLDSEDQTLLHAAEVKKVTDNHYMPLGNITQMTEEEREMIRAWSGTAD